jgi:hypothetical protein
VADSASRLYGATLCSWAGSSGEAGPRLLARELLASLRSFTPFFFGRIVMTMAPGLDQGVAAENIYDLEIELARGERKETFQSDHTKDRNSLMRSMNVFRNLTRYTLHIAHCTLHIAYCTLHIAHCILHIVYCTLHIARCSLHRGPVTVVCAVDNNQKLNS